MVEIIGVPASDAGGYLAPTMGRRQSRAPPSHRHPSPVRLWLGIALFLVGAVTWFATGASFGPRRRAPIAPWVPRFGLAAAALGLSMLASTRTGVSWDISSIGFSLVAIVLFVWVLRDNLKR